MITHSSATVVARNTVFAEEIVTEPYDVAWAREDNIPSESDLVQRAAAAKHIGVVSTTTDCSLPSG